MKIYRTCNPSSFVSKEEIKDILKIKMTCGGGMGGSSWYEYVYDTKELDGEIPVWVTNYLGERIKLNPKFMVKVNKISIVKVTEDITAWKFYGGTKPIGEKHLRIRFIETPPYEKVELVNEFNYRANENETIKENVVIRRG
jgi:hypothetical protein